MTSLEKRLSLCRTDCQWRHLKQIPRAAFNQFDVENSPEFSAPVLKGKRMRHREKEVFRGFRGWRWAEISVLGEILMIWGDLEGPKALEGRDSSNFQYYPSLNEFRSMTS